MRTFIRTTLLSLVLSLCLVAPGSAAPLEDVDAAIKRGDYATALKHWRPLAEQGDASAQAKLGLMYVEGKGVPQDYAEAAKWFRKAAEQGQPEAQFNLGMMYATALQPNYTEAHKWFYLSVSRIPASEPERRNQVIEALKIIEKSMTTAQIAEAQRLAREWGTKKFSMEPIAEAQVAMIAIANAKTTMSGAI